MELRVKPRLHFTRERERFDSPEGIRECSAQIDGALRTWKEYIPESYDGSKPFPVVFTLHGGSSKKGKDNHHAELSTAWAAVAEREGFLVVYPQSLTPEHTWSAWEDFSDEERTRGLKDDIRYLDSLIALIRKKYRVDETRLYLHGQSFGDVMATYYLLNQPNHPFAAAATLSGPVGAGRLFDAGGGYRFGTECAVPLVRTHGMKDLALPLGRYQHLEDTVRTFDLMREAGPEASEQELLRRKMELHQLPLIENWKHCCGCEGLPHLSVCGRYNAASWDGNPDFHFYMVEGGGHGPSMDMADFIWTYFFSGYRRVEGKFVRQKPLKAFVPDQNVVAVADGAALALVNHQRKALSGPARELDGCFYVPVSSIKTLYPDLEVSPEEEGQSVVLRKGEQWMQLSACNRTFVWCNHLCHGERALLEDGTLLVPLAQVGQYFYGRKKHQNHGICYLSEREGDITFDFAYLVRQILGMEPVFSTKEMWEREAKLLENACQPG